MSKKPRKMRKIIFIIQVQKGQTKRRIPCTVKKRWKEIKFWFRNNNKAPIAKEINETINIFKNIRNQLSVSKDLSLSISFENYKDFGCFSSTKKSSAAKKLKTVPNQQLRVEKLDFFEKKPLMLEDKFNKILEKANNISKKIKRLYWIMICR